MSAIKSVFSLQQLRAALVGLDPDKENAEIRAWVAENTPKREHFEKVIQYE